MDILVVSGFLVIMNKLLWTFVYRFLYRLISLGYIPGDRIAGPYDNFVFNLGRKCGGSKT